MAKPSSEQITCGLIPAVGAEAWSLLGAVAVCSIETFCNYTDTASGMKRMETVCANLDITKPL